MKVGAEVKIHGVVVTAGKKNPGKNLGVIIYYTHAKTIQNNNYFNSFLLYTYIFHIFVFLLQVRILGPKVMIPKTGEIQTRKKIGT